MAQQTLFIRPDASCGKDAVLNGLSSQANINYGSDAQLPAAAWLFSGDPGDIRSVIQFDISSIPAGCTILSAKLSLYAWDQSGGFGQHSSINGPNTTLIQRITSPWSESTVTWNTQPASTGINEVLLPSTTNALEDYVNINVTSLVQDMVNDPLNSHGFMLRLETEDYYRSMNFCSSDHSLPLKRPSLSVVCDCSFTPVMCNDTLGTPVPVPPDPYIPLPAADNVFSPNGDGVNDVFSFSSAEHSEIDIVIYNRWGEAVFEQTGESVSWDGSNANEGVYYYTIRATERLTGKIAEAAGFIQLVK